MESRSRSLVNFRGSILQVVPTATVPPSVAGFHPVSHPRIVERAFAPALRRLRSCRDVGWGGSSCRLCSAVQFSSNPSAESPSSPPPSAGREERKRRASSFSSTTTTAAAAAATPSRGSELWVRGDGGEAPSPAGGAVFPGVRSGGSVLKRKKEKRSVMSE